MMVSESIKEGASLILNAAAIEWKILRMAYEIYENNASEKEIILAGIANRGSVLSDLLTKKLKQITPIRITTLEIQLDKKNPLNATLKGKADCREKSIIIVDDVANSGRTLFYGMLPFMHVLPKKIQTAVLIDRMHKSFPISVDYTGYLLSTTLQENVTVAIADGKIKGAYLN